MSLSNRRGLAATLAVGVVLLLVLLQATSVAAQTDYTGKFGFPRYHVRPPTNWINDPNGMFRDPVTGKVHLWLQYNPHGALSGNKSWLHMTSDDYLKWHMPSGDPVSMYRDRWYDGRGVYSGAGMINEATGMPMLIFTCVGEDTVQRQCIGYPTKKDVEGRRVFDEIVKSPLNPVMTEDQVPNLVLPNYFRDPTEWWRDPTNPDRWLVAFVARINDDEGDNTHVVVFSTEDPTWQSGYEFSHSLYLYKYDLDKIFDCPDFFEVDDTNGWFLKVSLRRQHRDAIVYGSYEADPVSGKYVYVEDPNRSYTLLDYGPYFATKSYYDTTLKRRLNWGWTREEMDDALILQQGWSGVQGLVRDMVYDPVEKVLRTFPMPELQGLRRAQVFTGSGITVGNLANPTVIVPAGTTATRYHEIVAKFHIDSSVFASDRYYTEDTAPEFGVMVRTNADNSKYTTLSVRMPANTQAPTQGVIMDDTFPPFKIYPVDGADIQANCSAQCLKDRACVAWATSTDPSPQCTLYWVVSDTVANSSAVFGKPNVPLLYLGREKSGTVGFTYSSHGRGQLTQTHPNEVELRVFVDDSVLEVYKDGGLEVLSGRVYLPLDTEQDGIAVFARNMGAVTADVRVFTMDSIFVEEKPNVIRNYTNSLYDLLTTMVN